MGILSGCARPTATSCEFRSRIAGAEARENISPPQQVHGSSELPLFQIAQASGDRGAINELKMIIFVMILYLHCVEGLSGIECSTGAPEPMLG